MEELFFDIYERRFNPAIYQAAVEESVSTNPEQKKEKERDSREERLNISRESC